MSSARAKKRPEETESPKFLLSQGKEQEAINVLIHIAKFNRAPPPTLTVEDFAEVEAAYMAMHPSESSVETPRNQATYSHVIKRALGSLKHLKGIFATKLQSFIFVLLALAYMVSYRVPCPIPAMLMCRATTGHSTWLEHSCQSSCCETTSTTDEELSKIPMRNTSISSFQESLEPSWVSLRSTCR